jgi:thiol-disulfide isomerase/thioredoxin
VLTDAEGAVVDGRAEIRFRVSAPSDDETIAVTGRIVDDNGEPLADAVVALCTSGSMTLFHGRTDETGEFTISRAPTSLFRELSLSVRRDGFTGVETRAKRLPEKTDGEPLDFGTIRLSPGHEVRVRVLDPDGRPVLGAWVEPTGSFAARAEFTPTDAEGRCTFRNLALGVQSASVRFGHMNAQVNLVVTAEDAGEVIVRLSPPPEEPPEVIAERERAAVAELKPLAVGETAPEWEVAAWTDGARRKLSDYRGKVVVIAFWSVSRSSSLLVVPGLKDVQEQFRDHDVVFLAIHPPGTELNRVRTDLDQVRDVMTRLEWDWPSALDAEDETARGATVQRYGVRGFSNIVIVGRDGKVAFNTHDETTDAATALKEREQIAKELDIPWPFPKDTSREEGLAWQVRMFAHRLSKAIEAAVEREGAEGVD